VPVSQNQSDWPARRSSPLEPRIESGRSVELHSVISMGFTEIQQQVSQMSPEGRDKLSAFLVALRIQENDFF